MTDIFVYHALTLDLGNTIRLKLLKHLPRPTVYLYPVSPDGDGGYDIHIAANRGARPSKEFVVQIKEFIEAETPLLEEQEAHTAAEAAEEKEEEEVDCETCKGTGIVGGPAVEEESFCPDCMTEAALCDQNSKLN
ncbi:hypothetical protein LCGC14_0479310 [marine sediment metagenome]|uniref:Uncharacterized protein n=1 Tax=marine sediment metagenome TaxID=412755 RepID=A0A0F9S9P5_9ZZZZ